MKKMDKQIVRHLWMPEHGGVTGASGDCQQLVAAATVAPIYFHSRPALPYRFDEYKNAGEKPAMPKA